jgi:hypothetical protein
VSFSGIVYKYIVLIYILEDILLNRRLTIDFSMQVTLNRSEKIIFDILMNDITTVDALNIITQYAAHTNLKIIEKNIYDDAFVSIYDDDDIFISKKSKTPTEFVSVVYKPRPCDDVPRSVDDIMKAKRTRKSKDRVPPSEEALLSADAALIQAAKQTNKNYKGSPVTKEEFLEAFDQRMEDMRDES